MRQYFLRAAKRAETNPVVPNVVLSWSLIGRKACAQASFGGAMRGAIGAPFRALAPIAGLLGGWSAGSPT